MSDLISRSYVVDVYNRVKEACKNCDNYNGVRCRACDIGDELLDLQDIIDNAPAVEPFERIGAICNENCGYNPQGEYVDISKLRLMTVEECAGHTIDYAMGWKACIEWIKNGGDMKEDRRNETY